MGFRKYLHKNMSSLLNVRYAAPFLLAGALGIFSGMKSYEHERIREARIPLGFSEIHQIEQDAQQQGRIVAENNDLVLKIEAEEDVRNQEKTMARTLYLAGLNDLTMKVFECWNNANENNDDIYKRFARELEKRFDPTIKKHHYELSDLFEIVPQSCQEVKKQLHNFMKAQESLPAIIDNFDKSWSDSHSNHYHTIVYPSISYDSKGNAHMTLKTDQVYDNTTHSYNYDADFGEKASKSLNELLVSVPDIRLREKIFTASKTNVEGEKAAKVSRKKGEEEKVFSQEELKSIADTWYTGSTFTLGEHLVYNFWSDVQEDAKKWDAAKINAKSVSYNTTSRNDIGPLEYRVARDARNHGNGLLAGLNEVIGSVQYTEEILPKLRAKISEFVNTSKNSNNYNELGKNVLALAKEMYKKNFKKGFDSEESRTSMIVLWSFLGAISGALAGGGALAGLDKIAKRN